jgi:hypothetical protein
MAPQLMATKRRPPRAERGAGRGDQLLAGAALAGDQHRRDGAADALDEREHRLHLRALADDVVEGVFLLQLAAQVDVLVGQLGAFERLLGDDLQLLDVERFRHVVVGAELHRFDRRLGRGEGGHHHHRRRRAAALDLAQQVEAVAVGHQHVAEHQRVAGAGEGALRLGGRMRGIDREPFRLEEQRQEVENTVLVVDDEELGRHGPRSPASRSAPPYGGWRRARRWRRRRRRPAARR